MICFALAIRTLHMPVECRQTKRPGPADVAIFGAVNNKKPVQNESITLPNFLEFRYAATKGEANGNIRNVQHQWRDEAYEKVPGRHHGARRGVRENIRYLSRDSRQRACRVHPAGQESKRGKNRSQSVSSLKHKQQSYPDREGLAYRVWHFAAINRGLALFEILGLHVVHHFCHENIGPSFL